MRKILLTVAWPVYRIYYRLSSKWMLWACNHYLPVIHRRLQLAGYNREQRRQMMRAIVKNQQLSAAESAAHSITV